MDNTIALAIPLFAFILIGFAAGSIGGRWIPTERRDLVWLNIFVVYFAIPALIFRLISRAPIENLVNWGFIAGTTLTTYVVFLLMLVVATSIGGARLSVASLQAASASYGNVGYMGIPLAIAVFGTAGAIPATLILCFDSALLFVLVPLLVSISNPSEGMGRAILGAGKAIVLNPLIISLLLGIAAAFGGFTLSGPFGTIVDQTLLQLGNAAAPAALFGIGITIAKQYSTRSPMHWEVFIIAMIKLIIHPILLVAILAMLGDFDSTWISVAILLASLPTAANVYVMALQADTYVEGTSNAILVSTTLSLFTLPALMILMAEGHLPYDFFALFR